MLKKMVQNSNITMQTDTQIVNKTVMYARYTVCCKHSYACKHYCQTLAILQTLVTVCIPGIHWTRYICTNCNTHDYCTLRITHT